MNVSVPNKEIDMTESITETETQIVPERGKKIALARFDLIKKWEEYRSEKIDKLKADYEFVALHNVNPNTQLYQILGKICRGSLHRWKTKLKDIEDYANNNEIVQRRNN